MYIEIQTVPGPLCVCVCVCVCMSMSMCVCVCVCVPVILAVYYIGVIESTSILLLACLS